MLNRFAVPAVKRGVASPLPVGLGLVVLETVGRRSGLPRQVPLVAVRVRDALVVSTVRQRSQWIDNAAANPSVGVWLGGARRPGSATVRRGVLQFMVLDVHDRAAPDAALAC
ncbi:MAG: nitroreductase family deazaflavin-dependent oxidoreductase [Acidimicrobiia bacterium]|nr:nitroreductase family deazaflavin-dependent oxidoreductase [Acidimicrobiia bacterium]